MFPVYILISLFVFCFQNNTSTGDVFENKMSDIVRGTVKPLRSDDDEDIIKVKEEDELLTAKPNLFLTPPPSPNKQK